MKFNFKKFNILNIVFLSAIFCFLSFSITFAQTGFFEDDFMDNSASKIYSGDECRQGNDLAGDGSGKWNVYLQNISCLGVGHCIANSDITCIDNDDCPSQDCSIYRCKNNTGIECTDNDICPGQDTCGNYLCENKVAGEDFSCDDWNNLPFSYVHQEPFWISEGFDPNWVNAKVEIGGGKLKMEREYKTLTGGDGVTDYNDRLGHRYMVVKSTKELVSSETFKLDMSVRLSEPTGWGIGWYVGNIVDAWYPNVAQNTLLKFPGLGTGQACPSLGNGWKCGINAADAPNDCFCNLPGQDEQEHRIEVWSQGNNKKIWVDKGTANEWYKEGSCISSCPFSGGYVWIGNRVQQCGGWTTSSVCSVGTGGPGPWPVFEMFRISLKRGPMNKDVIPDSGCGGGINSNETFTTTYYDDDGDFKNVQMLINSTADIEAPGDTQGFFWGKLQKIGAGSNFEFCLMNDVDDNGNSLFDDWVCESDNPGGNLENTYGILDPLISNYSFDADGTTLTVNWDIEFLSAWEQENNNIWLYVIDDSDLEDAFEDLGDYNIDNKAPDIPIKILPDSCTNDDTPI
ncbi:MAG: hypothetical protein ISS87_02790, partial [Candidatus Pacebacteria bacterium]|nr:hypothetical protein [Candidatus Paceibacterota bacterium]